MAKRKEINVAERKIIIHLWKQGKTLRKIDEIVERTYYSIQRAINNFKNTGILASKPRSGRPPKLTQRKSKVIVHSVKENPRLTASKIAENINSQFNKHVSKDTVRRILKKANYRSRVARKKPPVSLTNRQNRIAFVKEHINKPPEFWKKVIFTDESKYCILGIKGRQLVWRKPCTALHPKKLKPTVKHGGGGIMVWGCMSSKGVGNLEFIPSTMDHRIYLDVLKNNLTESVTKLGIKDDYIFQQDNDPKHTAQYTRLWLLYNVRKQLKTPPQSPDLNPIEHLWDLLERKIRNHVITSKDMLQRVLIEEWGKISSEYTEKLVSSMPKRLNEVLARRGYPTSY